MNQRSQSPSREQLLQALKYDPATGELRWAVNTSSTGRAGDLAGCKDERGYIVVRLQKKLHLAHRLIWLMVTGEAPPKCVDHINCDKGDNRWVNLRASDKVANGQNRAGAQSNNLSTGCRNVSFLGRGNRPWSVNIKHPGGKLSKCFDNLLDAACFAHSWRIRLHEGNPLNAPPPRDFAPTDHLSGLRPPGSSPPSGR